MKTNVLEVMMTMYKRERKFYVLETEDNKYVAVEDCDISNGMLNKSLNGLQMHISDNMQDTIKRVERQIEFDYYTSLGINIFENKELLEKIFS